MSAREYVGALRVARAIHREIDAMLRQHRLAALLLATVPTTAAPIGAESIELAGRRVPVGSAYASLTALASVTGHPALSVPSGLGRDGLPIGAQLIGPAGSESALCPLGEGGRARAGRARRRGWQNGAGLMPGRTSSLLPPS